MAKGYIYCVSNPSFQPNIYKIGFTTMNLEKRINSLYKTGVPTKFVINFAKMVRQCHRTEQDIHIRLKKLRINPSREFFKCSETTIRKVFDKIEGVWWNKETFSAPPRVRANVKSKRIKLYRTVKKSKFNYKV